ncbi:MAG: polysaccharide biosynthesis protein [Crocinitomicaceae bacterium]|nr:polysaccharide biosynthesis protein [Crocinitomicaceae bacterium]MCF8444813.1 polysaccharide biosynthesis protein [Crocinitomicaceae bacterium]
MISLRKHTPRWVIVLLDLLLNISALAFAYLIRFDLKAEYSQIEDEWNVLSKSILFYIIVKFAVFQLFRIQKGLVRYTSTEDLRRIFLAIATTTLIFTIASIIRAKFMDGYYLFPTSILIMEFIVSFAFTVGSRFVVKLIYLEATKDKSEKVNVAVYGAGVSGLITKRTISKDRQNHQKIIGFLDDNKKLHNTRLEGTRIYAPDKLEDLAREFEIKTLIIAIQNPDTENINRVVEKCLSLGIVVQKVPRPRSWINGEFSSKQLSKINIEDLLGRKPIQLDQAKISNELKGKVILVTGAAGSIGSGLVKQIGNYEPKNIILLDQAESALYDLQQDLHAKGNAFPFEIVIGDIRNYDRLKRVFDFYKPEYVFHAAAYKHVPLMENNPSEAVFTNVKGTKNLVDLSLEFGVHKFVMISTDKAVNPTNVMGASKRVAEIYAQTKNNLSTTKFITTRFGNVLGSNGSVIPLFQKQIEQGGPLTITDERITRFFMTIPEACQLVLEAGSMGNGGEIFVFDMGKSVKILDLAKKMIQLSGLEIGKDIEIKVTGLRPGEKLYEELLASEENTIPTHNPQILIAKTKDNDEEKLHAIEELIHLFEMQQNDQIVRKMKAIVPEYISNNSEFEKLDTK